MSKFSGTRHKHSCFIFQLCRLAQTERLCHCSTFGIFLTQFRYLPHWVNRLAKFFGWSITRMDTENMSTICSHIGCRRFVINSASRKLVRWLDNKQCGPHNVSNIIVDIPNGSGALAQMFGLKFSHRLSSVFWS